MRVPRTRLAHQDLFEIWEYIAGDKIDAADRLLEELEDTFSAIFDTPEMGRSRSEDFRVPSLRSLPLGNYVIFYCPNDEGEGVTIVRVLNAARDIKPLLGE